MPFLYTSKEIVDTIRMIELQSLDVRTITLGINLKDCSDPDVDGMKRKVLEKIERVAGRLVSVSDRVQSKYGVPIVNKRIAVTPISLIISPALTEDLDESLERAHDVALCLDRAAKETDVDFIGGYSALVDKDMSYADRVLIKSFPRVLADTETLCCSVVAASTRSGMNMDAVNAFSKAVKETSLLTPDGSGCCRLIVLSNPPQDNPFMAGAFFGVGEGEAAINVGLSGPGVIRSIIEDSREKPLNELAEDIKKAGFKITRVGQLIGKEIARGLGVRFGVVDLSLAPTAVAGDSVAEIIECIGAGSYGGPGSTAALAMLVDAIKKGGIMAAESAGGLSGAFIPVSEDAGAFKALERGSLSLEKLEAMSSVCSVGLDMVAIPGDTAIETIAGLIADELMIGVMNNKTTAVRIIPVPGRKAGEHVEFGGLLGRSIVMPVSGYVPEAFVGRGGRIPAPMRSLTN